MIVHGSDENTVYDFVKNELLIEKKYCLDLSFLSAVCTLISLLVVNKAW